VLVLRPEPGGSETCARANALGLQPVLAPLFDVHAIEWQAPDPGDFDAVMMTSAHAPRLAGDQLHPFKPLPCYAVGEATAAAAAAAGFGEVKTGHRDVASLVEQMRAEGIRTPFHPCGREHVEHDRPELTITRRPVYAADPVLRLPDDARLAVENSALVLLHSPRAAEHFVHLSDLAGIPRSGVRIAAISAEAARAAGDGWAVKAVAPEPRDHALLELAAKLCQIG
jgi:uroporphyrinogen-III synthase